MAPRMGFLGKRRPAIGWGFVPEDDGTGWCSTVDRVRAGEKMLLVDDLNNPQALDRALWVVVLETRRIPQSPRQCRVLLLGPLVQKGPAEVLAEEMKKALKPTSQSEERGLQQHHAEAWRAGQTRAQQFLEEHELPETTPEPWTREQFMALIADQYQLHAGDPGGRCVHTVLHANTSQPRPHRASARRLLP